LFKKFHKILAISLIVFSLTGGLLIFNLNDDLIKNFRPYYAKAYIEAAKYKLYSVKEENKIPYGNASGVPVLLYHGILSKPDSSNVSLDNFEKQMLALKKAGYQTVTIGDFIQFSKGQKSLPDKSFLLTFDDGRKDSYYPVNPILKALNYNAVIFLITDEVGSNGFYLSEKEMNQMIKSGHWEFQSHGKADHGFIPIGPSGETGHFLTNKSWLKEEKRFETDQEYLTRLENDSKGSEDYLLSKFNIKAESFAYPLGDFGQNETNFQSSKIYINQVESSNFTISFYQTRPGEGQFLNYPDNNFKQKRIEVNSQWTGTDLLYFLESAREKPASISLQNTNKSQGWLTSWGESRIINNTLLMKSNDKTEGSLTYLNGAYNWTDYSFRARGNWVEGNNIMLLARYQDDANYVVFNISDHMVRIEQVVNGKAEVLKEERQELNLSKEDIEIGFKVYKDNIECYLNNKLVISTNGLNPNLANGGVGFKTWDPQLNNSELIINKFEVEKL